ncbi:MAG: histidinol-phosphate aminotransferase family protein [Rhodospirillaceae bacterium]|jgi:histidinol-phosphate aminotransferase|nr:histidinol-phosphate aminotransferase family protein [Rhodospirillaceae bacterium]MBT4940572.1 histidinol-phosphate aminotransferase family protein [Rhodospirillaceae bacterium]MBT5938323.1 histidinol-phosphate aminotransferase family protein [Rhodospirillaceae bacterium]MBT7266929.1 histidinol-phosphate aminotransferase family protein [Rhodospirillaceae bacterium]
MDGVRNSSPYIRQALKEAPNKVDPPTDGVLRYQGLDTSKILNLGLNECCYPPSPKVIEAMQQNLSAVNLYPDAQCPHLTDIITERTGIERDRIVWGNGSEELLKGAVDLSLSPGQGVVLPVPTFWGYKSMIAAFEANVAEVENLADGQTDIDGVLAAIHEDTKIVFLITPNNPSGRMIDQEGLEKIVKGVPEDILLCVDEAYYDFGLHAGGPNVLDILKTRRGPWITVFTFSKAYAMAGMRIGYAICSDPELAQALQKTTCVFNVPILAQHAGEAALLDLEYLDFILTEIAAGRDQLYDGLVKLGLKPFPSVTNFVSTPVSMNGRDCMKAMLDKGVQINAWADPGYENYIRITVGTQADNATCLAALKEVLS